MEYYELLKEATAKKKTGDLQSAIKLLREAYEISRKEQIELGIKDYLRLPMYLQEAGENDQAWKELNNLLTRQYLYPHINASIRTIEHSAIYDAMRLFLQRENKNEKAVAFGICSLICWGISLYKQWNEKGADSFFIKERKERFREDFSPDNIKLTVTKLLKKADRIDLVDIVSNITTKYVENIPNVKLGKLMEDIDRVFVN